MQRKCDVWVAGLDLGSGKPVLEVAFFFLFSFTFGGKVCLRNSTL